MSKVQELRDLIKGYAQSYYEGNQEISDEEFDLLIEELRKISPNDNILTTPGWGYTIDSKVKIDHIGSKVGSLDKIKHPEPCETRSTIITPKIDGSSIVLYYEYGKLTKALTRGDGEKGMSCLNKMRYLLSHVKVDEPGLVSIRGEVFVPSSFHEDLIKKGIPSPRNYANGIINRIEAGEDIKLLRFIPYSVRIYRDVLTKSQMIEKLTLWGFKRIPFIKGEGDEDLEQIYQKWVGKFPIDGLVITQDSNISASKIGSGQMAITESAIAYKFESPRAQVIVGSIEWQVGETGRVIPVIKLQDSVFLSGANISSITAHNATQVKEKGLGSGAKIIIERSGEVIPYLVSVESSSQADLPDLCPVCGKLLQWKNMDLVCINLYCKAKQDAIIESILEVCGIPDGFGDVFLDKWIDSRKVEDFLDYSNQLTKGTVEVFKGEGHYGKLVVQLSNNIISKFSEGFTYEEFWKMVRIPGLADSHAKKLRDTNPQDFIDHYDDIENLVNKIGTKLKLPVNVIDELFKTYRVWIRAAKSIPFIQPVSRKTTVMSIVVTGPVSMPRREFEKFLTDNGVEMKDSVSKDIKYLVCNESNSSSTKFKKATQLGIPIITEDALMNILGFI